jgi:formylglycine-generating enzyme required for sulfatase activity
MKRNKSLCGFGFIGFQIFAMATLFLFGHLILIAQEQKSPRPALPSVQSVGVKGIKFELASIPAGEFQMGSDTGDVLEKPTHPVRVGSFQLARTEVTVRLFRAFVDATGYKTQAEKNGSTWKRDLEALEKGGRPWAMGPINWRSPGFPQSEDDPVVCISWGDAVAFCQWLAKETGSQFRLPTEAEWEYACRAGASGDYAGNLEEIAWYRENSNRKTQPVGQKKPNAWGLFDMHGNSWEWCGDVWQLYPGAPTEGLPPWIKEKKVDMTTLRPLKGGAWGLDKIDYRSGDLRITSRVPYPVDQSCNNSGFRVASDLGRP